MKPTPRGRRVIAQTMATVLLASSIGLTAISTSSARPLQTGLNVAKQIADESIVLLKNETGGLPLAKGEKISVFGSTQLDPYLGGGGSGSVSADGAVSFLPALREEGFQLNEDLVATYTDWWNVDPDGDGPLEAGKDQDYRPSEGSGGALGDYTTSSVAHAEMPLSSGLVREAAQESDTAVIIIGRSGSEGLDLGVDDMKLYPGEQDMVDKVATTFDRVVVLFNICNTLEMNFLDEYDSIKSAAVIWAPGQIGMRSVADVLSGVVNPSGKLPDTIAVDVEDHPAVANFGDFVKPGSEPQLDKYYIEYEEGIYVGYRYFETFDVPVKYEFGYGLSYTNFDHQVVDFDIDADTVTVSTKVTNTGDVAGKDVVEIYFSAPDGELEKPAKELAGFGKTSLLAPGKSEVVTVSFPLYELSSYSEARGAYLLDAGEYTIYEGKSVKDVVVAGTYTQTAAEEIDRDPITDGQIENRFAHANNGLVELSKFDPQNTYPTPAARGTKTVPSSGWGPTGYNTLTSGNTGGFLTEPGAMPTLSSDSLRIPLPEGTDKAPIQLVDVYEGKASMTAFINQLTDAELTALHLYGGFQTLGIDRLGIPSTNSNDGPASVKAARNSGLTNGTAYPVGTALAATWNVDLAEDFGKAAATEAEALNIHSWYAPGANTHRTPLGGRNFEYFSEDPTLGGLMLAASSIGAQENGLTPVVKHFAANDIEINRLGVETYVSERAFREIYLKQFEYAIKGGAMGVMSGLNRIGEVWAGADEALLTGVLRDEWGFKGFVVSDAWVGGYMNSADAAYAGNDTMLRMFSIFNSLSDISKELEENPVEFRAALRRNAASIMRYVMTTRAFSDVITSTDNLGTTVNRAAYPFQTTVSRAFTTSPKVSVNGKAVVGQKLTAQLRGSWTPAADTVTWQWSRNGQAISGATSANYTVTSADKGAVLTVEAKATRDGYASDVVSATAGTVAGQNATTTTVALPAKTSYGKAVSASVSVAGDGVVGGKVTLQIDGRDAGSATLTTSGKASFKIPATLNVGKHSIRAQFTPAQGATALTSQSSARTLTVAKAGAKLTVTTPKKVTAKKRATLKVRATVPGTAVKVTGKITVKAGKKTVGKGSLKNGTVSVKLKKLAAGKKSLKVTYYGSATVTKTSTTVSVKVRAVK